MKRRLIAIVLLIAIAIPIVFWVSSLVKCEALTRKYYEDFAHAHEQNSWVGELEYFKVLECDDTMAQVYYVSKGRTCANVLTFEKQDGIWQEKMFRTIWSDTGSASEVIYPYWWHFIYGGI